MLASPPKIAPGQRGLRQSAQAQGLSGIQSAPSLASVSAGLFISLDYSEL